MTNRSEDRGGPAAESSENELFRAYQGSGDPAALALVFDRVAPRLLLLAAHLSRDHATAEDLVQSTFVAAIEDAGSFRPGQPLLPWLNGILVHRWRQERRRRAVRQRHLETPRGDEPLLSGSPPAPDEEVAGEELLAAVAAAIERLPLPYQGALNLRLVHGLQPVEIAHALGLSPGTVRSQLRRGLALLRAHLPRSLVLPVVLTAIAGEGLAAVRRQVLAAVPGRAAATTTLSSTSIAAGGILLMKKWLAASVVVLLAFGVFVWNADAWRAPPVDEGAPVRVPLADAQAGPAASGATAPGRGEQRVEERGQRDTMPPVAAPALQIVGCCVEGDTREPLAGVRVELEREFAAGEWEARDAWTDPAAVTSGADGRFGFELAREQDGAAEGIYRLRFHSDPPRIQQVGCERLRFAGREEIDVGEVRLFRTVLLVGRITDSEGRPLPGMGMRFYRLERNPLSEQDVVRAPADDEGRFEVRLERGSWGTDTQTTSFATTDAGCSNRLTPAAVDLAGPSARVEVVLVSDRLGLGHRIAGRVVDASGRPMAGAEMHFHAPGEWALRGQAYTDDTGAFAAYVWKEGIAPDAPGVRVLVSSPGASWGDDDPWTSSAFYRWGVEDARIVVDRSSGHRVPIVVRLAGEGSIVEEFGVAVGKKYLPRARSSRHEGGRAFLPAVTGAEPPLFSIDGGPFVSNAPQYFRVDPRDPALMPSAVQAVPRWTETAAASPMTVYVHRRRDLLVEVLDAQGVGVAGSSVLLVQPTLGLDDPAADTATSGGAPGQVDGFRAGRPVADGEAPFDRRGHRVGRAVTDAAGIARLSAPAGGSGLLLVALGPGHVRKTVHDVAIPADASRLTVTVSRGAAIEGTVRPRDIVERLTGGGIGERRSPRVTFECITAGEAASRPGFPAIDLAADGTFVAPGLSPGTWRLRLSYASRSKPGRIRSGHQAVFANLGGWEPIAVVSDLRENERRRIEIDVMSKLPGTLKGRVLVGGEPLRSKTIYFFRLESEMRATMIDPKVVTDQRGAFVMPHLMPGEYVIWREVRGVSHDEPYHLGAVPCEGYVRLPPGGTIEQDFHSRTGALHVRFRKPDGKPFAGTRVNFVLDLRTRWTNGASTDADGVVRLPVFPRGDIRLECGKYRFDPPRIHLRGTEGWEEFEVVVHEGGG